MANTIKIKQSSVSGRVPQAADLEQGELAINTLDEKLYTKNSSGAVVELGTQGAYLNKVDATSAPTANDDSADGYQVGSIWIDVTNDIAYTCVDASSGAAVWTQGGGSGFVSAASAPSSPEEGDMWFDNSAGGLYIRLGTTWVDISTSSSSGYSSGTSAPSSPNEGDLWFNPTTAILYIRLGTAWIDISTSMSGGAFTTNATAPSSPLSGDLWFDSANGILFVRIGSVWVDISTAGSDDTKLPLAGGTMTGDITFNSTQQFDGRDLSVDGAKLDLIEASADVTDATNVEAAGALMDSEVTNLADVKAINQSLTTTASPTFATANVTTVDLGDWTVTESSGTLYFAHSGTNKMKIDSSGNLTVTGDVTAFGSV